MSPAAESSGWVVVLPVKGGPEAKTRLSSPGVIDASRLALAFAADLMTAVRGTPEVLGVVVVSSDAMSRQALAGGGTILSEDPGTGLNAAAVAGITAARRARPAAGVVVMLADLPCVTPADVSQALTAAAGHSRSFIRDAQGTGTTLIALASGVVAEPLFGAFSAARHLAAGFAELALAADARIRLDVDTPEDLAIAVMLGVGAKTTALLS